MVSKLKDTRFGTKCLVITMLNVQCTTWCGKLLEFCSYFAHRALCHSKLFSATNENVHGRNLIECAMAVYHLEYSTLDLRIWERIWHSNMTYKRPWSPKLNVKIKGIDRNFDYKAPHRGYPITLPCRHPFESIVSLTKECWLT